MARSAKQRRAENDRQAKIAAIQRAEQRRRGRLQLVGGSVALIVVVVVGIFVAGAFNKPNSGTGSGSKASIAKVVAKVTSVPASVYNAVGLGSGTSLPQKIQGESITSNGLPHFVYVGAEYCPYCAAERWALAEALSRFGTLKGIGETQSSGTDVYPNTATLAFSGSTYTSKYLAFNAYETQNRQGQPLDTLPTSVQALMAKYDAPPYIDAAHKGSIPFIYFDGKYLTLGASYDPATLKGMSHQQIAAAMHDASSAAGKAINSAANVITAAMCASTKQQPTAVCTASGVKSATAVLAQSKTVK